MKVKDMILVALFTALIAVGAFIKIPIPYVPLTLQLMFTNLAALALGSKRGALSSFLYVLIGLMGIPIFTKGGGPWYVFQPTFGYLVAFVIGAYVAGKIVEKSEEKNLKVYLIASAVNILIVYSLGFAYGIFIINVYFGKGVAIRNLIPAFVLTPLPGDIITLTLSSTMVNRLKRAVKIRT